MPYKLHAIPIAEHMKERTLREQVINVLLERYYGVKHEDKLAYHYQTADRILALLEEE